MPAGDIFDIVVKILAILATPLAGLAVWALTRHVRLTHLQAEHEKLRSEKESLEGKLEETRRASNELRQASADRYDKLRSAYHEARDKFYRIKAAAHSLRGDAGTSTTSSRLECRPNRRTGGQQFARRTGRGPPATRGTAKSHRRSHAIRRPHLVAAAGRQRARLSPAERSPQRHHFRVESQGRRRQDDHHRQPGGHARQKQITGDPDRPRLSALAVDVARRQQGPHHAASGRVFGAALSRGPSSLGRRIEESLEGFGPRAAGLFDPHQQRQPVGQSRGRWPGRNGKPADDRMAVRSQPARSAILSAFGAARSRDRPGISLCLSRLPAAIDHRVRQRPGGQRFRPDPRRPRPGVDASSRELANDSARSSRNRLSRVAHPRGRAEHGAAASRRANTRLMPMPSRS